MEHEDLDCCISPNGNTPLAPDCEWVSSRHLTLLPPQVPRGRPRFRRPIDRPVGPLKVGDPVVAKDVEQFTLLPEMGYVSDIDDTMVGITYARGGETHILVKKGFVAHA